MQVFLIRINYHNLKARRWIIKVNGQETNLITSNDVIDGRIIEVRKLYYIRVYFYCIFIYCI